MKQELFMALARAAVNNDRARISALTLQAAAHTKSEPLKRELTLLGSAHRPSSELPHDVRSMARSLGDVDQLILSESIEQELCAIEAEHQAHEALFAHGLRPRNRLLFVGEPGNGKTSAAALLCQRLGTPAYGVSLPGIVADHLGVTSRNLAKLLPLLDNGISLVLDEVDAIGGARVDDGESAGKERNNILNTILTLLDQSRGGLLIATTNRRDMLDPALLRRFDAEILFRPPTSKQTEQLATMLCERYRVPLTHIFDDDSSFDAVAKAVMRHARSYVLGLTPLHAASRGSAVP